MVANPFAGLESTLEKTKTWVHEVMDELERTDPAEAYHALRAALHALRDHLPLEEVAHLGAQLPLLVRGVYYEGWRPRAAHDRDVSGALAEMRHELGPASDLDPELALRAALAVVQRHISPGEMADVTRALPRRWRAMLT